MKKIFTLYQENLDLPNISTKQETYYINGIGYEAHLSDGPSDRVINNLLRYACALSIFKSKLIGDVKIILN